METTKYTQKDNSGSLFKNDKKTAENQPDYRGTGNFKGYDFEISAWLKTSKSGQTYMSLQLQVPYVKDGATTQQGGARSREDIPF